MTDAELLEILNKQRTFTHDISTPVSIAVGMLELALGKLKSNPGVDPNEIVRLEKSLKAMERLSKLIQENRVLLQSTAA